MARSYLRWVATNLLILAALIALWWAVAGLVITDGDLGRVLVNLPWLTIQFTGSLLPGMLVHSLLLLVLDTRWRVQRLRFWSVVLSPVLFILWVPQVLQSSVPDNLLVYYGVPLSLVVVYGLLMRLRPSGAAQPATA